MGGIWFWSFQLTQLYQPISEWNFSIAEFGSSFNFLIEMEGPD